MPRAPPTSRLARETLQRAFDELQQTITPQDWRAAESTTLEDVRKAALDIETQLAARQSLRNMRRLMPLLAGMEHYAKVMDILCNGTPFLSWVWAPITLILRIASEYVEAFEQIMKGYSRIAESLMRFEILNRAFANNHNFQQSLAAFYDDILQFHQHAYKFVRRNEWKLLFLTSWGRFQRRFENILDDLERHGDLIDKEANALNITEAQQMHREIRDWKEKSLESLGKQEAEQSGKQYQAIASWLKYDDSDQLAIFDSISTEANKYPGTCSWFILHPKAQSWLKRRADAPMLSLQGIPGSGKSSICAQVVNFMTAGKMPLIYYFCSSSYASSVMYEQILRSLLLQLACRSSDIIAHVYSVYVLGKKSPKIPALEHLLRNLFKVISHEPGQTEYIWIVLDGLSECQPEKQARMATLIGHITSRSSSSGSTICKALITCQASTGFSNYLKKEHAIFLADEKIAMDNAIQDSKEIELGTARKADGMFLYARLVLDYLAANIFYSVDEIKTSLNQLPEKLTDLLELLSAITFSSGHPDVVNLAPEYILEICGPLLEVRQDTTATFIHSSVKLFLGSQHSSLVVNETTTLSEHGLATITCLLSGTNVFSTMYGEQDRLYRVLKGIHSFHVYATEYWTEYLLSWVEGANSTDANSPLLTLACTLAQRLDETDVYSPPGGQRSEFEQLDKRMNSLVDYPLVFKHVGNFLRARSLKSLETELLKSREGGAINRPQLDGSVLDGISSMLAAYQKTVRHLLNQHDFPGISAEALKFFKTQLGNSAFTCRLKSCPRATSGFASEKSLVEHESSHLRQFPCTFPGCQYPPPVSAHALRNHEKRCHTYTPTQRGRRKLKPPAPGRQSTNTISTNTGSGSTLSDLPLMSQLSGLPKSAPDNSRPIPDGPAADHDQSQELIKQEETFLSKPEPLRPPEPENLYGLDLPNGMMPQQGQPGALHNQQQQMLARLRNLGTPVAPAHQVMMDSMELSPPLLHEIANQLRTPPEVRKWKDLRQWLAQNPVPPQLLQHIERIQRSQFATYMQRQIEKRNQQQAAQAARQGQQLTPQPQQPQHQPPQQVPPQARSQQLAQPPQQAQPKGMQPSNGVQNRAANDINLYIPQHVSKHELQAKTGSL
ncbi:NACHT domain-containing protein [Colletotrichum fioriniae PJ7]|uniref:NACHT domain-containing protein n=1 Tax=Colletotrichum fioriniae PJ7 TaxID=1445577 RepID=A0A010RG24_9PEZI|nr:NACHT domain-containing protein [Colletotrichum fioriniae PJ7]